MALTYEQAVVIADRCIRERIATSEFFSRYQFSDVGLKSENERFWTFVAGSDQLFEEGYVPGAVFACIDKQDGHLWSREEQEQFYETRAAARRIEPAIRVA